MSGTPFQDWCEGLLRARRWTLREYATSGIEAEPLARLYALAGARRMNLEAALNEALKIALPIMEWRAR